MSPKLARRAAAVESMGVLAAEDDLTLHQVHERDVLTLVEKNRSDVTKRWVVEPYAQFDAQQ